VTDLSQTQRPICATCGKPFRDMRTNIHLGVEDAEHKQHIFAVPEDEMGDAQREALERGCKKRAEWIITHGPAPDDYTLSCTEHVGYLLTDAKNHQVGRFYKEDWSVSPEQAECCYIPQPDETTALRNEVIAHFQIYDEHNLRQEEMSFVSVSRRTLRTLIESSPDWQAALAALPAEEGARK
jgi:hypothetical protein